MLKTLAVTVALTLALPAYAAESPTLSDPPKATGPAISLFNGRDLKDWDAWLGYRDPALTYARPAVAPIGVTPESAEIFKVVTEDGAEILTLP